MGWTASVQFPAETGQGYFFLATISRPSEDYPTSYPMCTGGYFPGGISAAA